jgi:hypothetical protein
MTESGDAYYALRHEILEIVNEARSESGLPELSDVNDALNDIRKWGRAYSEEDGKALGLIARASWKPRRDIVSGTKEICDFFTNFRETVSVLRHYGYPVDPVKLDRRLLAVDALKAAARTYVEKTSEE